MCGVSTGQPHRRLEPPGVRSDELAMTGSSAISAASTSSAVSLVVATKALDMQRQEGAQAVAMIKAAAATQGGPKGPTPGGVGGILDTVA